MSQVQVQVRVPEEIAGELDQWIIEGRFSNRSDAVKTILQLYEEREKTRRFAQMLVKRSQEAKQKPELLIPLGD